MAFLTNRLETPSPLGFFHLEIANHTRQVDQIALELHLIYLGVAHHRSWFLFLLIIDGFPYPI